MRSAAVNITTHIFFPAPALSGYAANSRFRIRLLRPSDFSRRAAMTAQSHLLDALSITVQTYPLTES